MAQGYYSLKEAAQLLSMSEDDLKQMAQRGKIRSFQDRGTLRFRAQDIQELARTRGVSSDPEQVLGDASLSKPKATSSGSRKKPVAASAGPKTPPKQEAAPDVFDFAFDGDNVDIAGEIAQPKSGTKAKPGSKSKKPATPPAGSDSDVRLVPDGNDVSFTIPKEARTKPPDSDVKIAADPLKPRTGVHGGAPSSAGKLAVDSGTQPKSKGGSSGKQASPRPGSAPQPDSGVRLVPLDSDSDVKLIAASDEVNLGGPGPGAATDSNVRLDKVALPPADSSEGGMMLTEEINLDEEIAKQQEKDKDKPPTKLKAKSELKLPDASPFELSDSDLELPSELKQSAGPKTPKKIEADSSDFDLAAQTDGNEGTSPTEGSSDFDLVPAADGSVLLEGDSKDFSLEAADDQVLQEEKPELTSSSSGISLDNPVDAGISLEEVADESGDFDLSLEPEATPKPQASQPAEDSSEFELTSDKTPRPTKKPGAGDSSEDDIDLSLDVDAPIKQEEDSEFEINLDGSDEGKAAGESDSEFELTLDDSGNLAALEEEPAKPQVKAKKGAPSAEEQDIFDTDFEVPALDESDDATVADSELESSDFDIALDDSDLANEEESGSQVVALDEEENAETAADEDGAVADDVEVEEESSDFADLDQDVEVETDGEVEEEEESDVEVETARKTVGKTKTVVKERLIEPAPWGVLPVVFMLPCVIVMFLVALLGYELLQTSSGARPPGPLTTGLADQFGVQWSLKKP